MCVTERILFIYVINRQMHIYQYVPSHHVILQDHDWVPAATFIRVTCDNNTINIQIIVQDV